METRKTIPLDREPQPDASQQQGTALGMIDPGLPKVGEHVTGFALEKAIHVGNMAVVYRALSTQLGADYAFKICRPCSSKAYRRAFVLKRNLHARLNCGDMASFVTGGTWNEELPYSVVAYYKGRTLQSILETSASLPPTVALSIGKIVVSVLKESCEKMETSTWAGYLYRCVWSIVPENVLITEFGDIRILDIGLEQFFDERLPLTMTWDELPPPQYSSTLDLSAIIYSIGTFYLSMLFAGQADYESILDPSFLSKKRKYPAIQKIIEKCMAGKIGACYTGFDEIIEDTQECLVRYSSAPEKEIVRSWFVDGVLLREKPKSKNPE